MPAAQPFFVPVRGDIFIFLNNYCKSNKIRYLCVIKDNSAMKKLLYLAICLLAGIGVLKAEDNVYLDAYGDLFGISDYPYGGSYLISSQFDYKGLNYAVVGVAPAQVGVMAPNVRIKITEAHPYDIAPFTPVYTAEYDKMPGGHASGEVEIENRFVHALGLSDYGDQNNCVCVVTRIMTGAFSNCTELTGITLPFFLTEIRPGAFYNCSKLEHVYVNGSPQDKAQVTIYPYVFDKCTSLKKVDMTIIKRVNINGGAVFTNCPNLEEIILRAEGEEFRMLTSRTVPSLKIVRVTTKNPNTIYWHSIGESPFLPEEYANAKLIVPDGSKEQYQAIEPWSNFSNILTESEYASAENIVVGHELVNIAGRAASLIDLDACADIYEVSGLKVATLDAETPEFTAPFPGIFIIKSGANSQKIVLQ